MKYRPKKFRNLKLAILFSGILSLFGVITNNTLQSDFDIFFILSGWFLVFSFLLIAWILNSLITSQILFNSNRWNLLGRISVITLSNCFLLMFFFLISVLISKSFHLEIEHSYIYLIVRGTISIAIIYLIQYTLNLNAKNQSVLLQNQMLKTENLRAEFEILKQQISPHFLFNSLSSLRSMIRTSNKNAEDFVIKLSDTYRLLLANKERDTVSLKEELEFIKDYSFLLFARYENMLSIEFDIADDLLDIKIPTFTLQLLVENCVKHNIVSKERPLNIKIHNFGPDSLCVENNLQQKINWGEESGHGLQNLRKRYELLGISDGVQMFSDESVFRVKIKLLRI